MTYREEHTGGADRSTQHVSDTSGAFQPAPPTGQPVQVPVMPASHAAMPQASPQQPAPPTGQPVQIPVGQPPQPGPSQPPVRPHYAAPYVSPKDHVAAGLLAIFLGFLGIHKFYLGYNVQGFIILAISVVGGPLLLGLPFGVMWIIGIVEGIIYLAKNQTEFEWIYVYNKREWF